MHFRLCTIKEQLLYKNHLKMDERCRDEKLSIIKNHWNKVELFAAQYLTGIGIDIQRVRCTFG